MAAHYRITYTLNESESAVHGDSSLDSETAAREWFACFRPESAADDRQFVLERKDRDEWVFVASRTGTVGA